MNYTAKSLRTVHLGCIGQSQMHGINDGGGPLDQSRRASDYSTWSDVAHGARTWYPDLIDLCHHYLGRVLDVQNLASGGSAAYPTYSILTTYRGNPNVINNWGEPDGFDVAGIPRKALWHYAQPVLVAAGVTHVEICLGTQDAGFPAAVYAANLALLVDRLLSMGIKIMMHHCPDSSSSARDEISLGHKMLLGSYVDDRTVWEGVNFYEAMPARQPEPGYSLLMKDTHHLSVWGYEWASRAIFRRYADTRWLEA